MDQRGLPGRRGESSWEGRGGDSPLRIERSINSKRKNILSAAGWEDGTPGDDAGGGGSLLGQKLKHYYLKYKRPFPIQNPLERGGRGRGRKHDKAEEPLPPDGKTRILYRWCWWCWWCLWLFVGITICNNSLILKSIIWVNVKLGRKFGKQCIQWKLYLVFLCPLSINLIAVVKLMTIP